MSGAEMILQQPWVTRAGWTLVHFLWQGSVIAILLAVVRAFAGRRLTARGRYALSCAALAIMTAAPLATFLAAGSLDAAALPRPALQVAGGETWDRVLPWLVVVWLTGVIVFSARIAAGWRVASRLRRAAAGPVPREWQQALNELIHRMRVSAPVRLLASALAPAPAVVGWLRPVILMPVEAMAGLPLDQIRALLAHELAHILRQDYLVNILQSIAEAVLFYHPAVWWVSGQIRLERELCCDDLAVEASGDVLTYATALADLDGRRRARLRTVLAADGGSLVQRIRRLAGESEPVSHTLPGPGAVWALTILWLAGIGAVALHAGQTPQARVALRPFVPRGFAAAPPLALPAPPSLKASPVSPMLVALLFDPFFVAPLPQSAPPDADKQVASVSGVVMTTSGTPISQAQVILLPTAPPRPAATGSAQQVQRFTATTGVDGKFAFEKLPPGVYRLMASHPVYVSPSSQGSVPGSPITLAAGQRVDDITVKLLEPATFSGRVVDEDGDPLAREEVLVLRYTQYYGRRRITATYSTATGDNGEFKVARVPPGRYVVKADGLTTWSANEREPVHVVKTGQKYSGPGTGYNGGARHIWDATPIDVGPGQNVPVGEIKVWNRPEFHVRGKVVGDPLLLDGARVIRAPSDPGMGFPWSSGADIQKDGSFDLDHMYSIEITVAVYSQKLGYLGWTGIVIGDEDVERVVINASAGLMSGSVKMEGSASDAALPPMRFSLTSTGIPAIITAGGAINADGSFTTTYVAPGKYIADVNGLPPGSYVKSIRLNGRDALNEPLEWRGAGGGAVEAVISSKAAALAGLLQDDDGTPVPGTVTLVPDPPVPGCARLYPTAHAGPGGNFQFQNLTPGQYKVYAWEEIDDTAHWDPDFMRPFTGRAQPLDVGEGGGATLSLKRISKAVMLDALKKVGM